MSKGIVDCVHWDPEVDPAQQEARKKNKLIVIIAIAAVAAVLVGMCLLLFRAPPPDDPATDGETTTGAQDWPMGTNGLPGDVTNTPPPQANDDNSFRLGKGFYDAKQYDAAVQSFNQSLAANPNNGEAFKYRGLSYFAQSNYTEAIKDLTQSLYITKEPSVDVFTFRGGAYYLDGQYYAAISDLSRAIEMDPRNASALEYRAHAYENTAQFALAQSDYEAATALKPAEPAAQTNEMGAVTP